ncbi:hypothetical protein B0J11DRAFT_439105 [Dendryphion nanum]|uniref:RanBP2-type domain-containing protein n=1 Tax=Dendryphion nanum TaxID=256645 RepID=A0A9P9DLJ9_9PLEO|nr:hypothetical protein B0J11DRAFT_439105 [Dendryphion nanum]
MDIPRGHAMLPLNDGDFLDFIINYFKAEYSPIRSFWSTATAVPRNSERWVSMGHELAPLSFRPANAQAQKDLESLDYFIRTKNLDAVFVRGLVVRYAKYENHDRLEKRLYECCRLDLMVRKALKEKHLINSLWPSPAPKSLHPELLQQGVKVRQWYGDMFNKYFRYLRSVERFDLRPEVEEKIKSSGTLMLVPFVDHLVMGNVDPIIPIAVKGAGYSNAAAWEQKERGQSYGEPERFEIRFDAPADPADTYTRTVVRTCKCMKCETTRDVTVVISVDPNPGPVAAQKYTPGYVFSAQDVAPRQPVQRQEAQSEAPPAAASQKKQCSRCTFLNHPELTACEMCSAELPDSTLVTKPPSPVISVSKPSHSHSASVPPPVASKTMRNQGTPESRPSVSNRHSLGSSLFSIFPFNQQHQAEHQPKLPPTQAEAQPAMTQIRSQESTHRVERPKSSHSKAKSARGPSLEDLTPPTKANKKPSTPPPNLIDDAEPSGPSRPPRELTMMPMTPPPTSETPARTIPVGLPQNLMDDFVPVNVPFTREEEDEDAGWGEMSREEAKRQDSSDEDEEDDDDGEVVSKKEGMIDLDEVARMEMGVWGEREEED